MRVLEHEGLRDVLWKSHKSEMKSDFHVYLMRSHESLMAVEGTGTP